MVFAIAVTYSFVSILLIYRHFFDLYFSIFVCAGTALFLGYMANKWSWAKNNNKSLFFGTFFGGFVALLPPIFVSYGFGLVVIIPLLLVWSGIVLLGIRLQKRFAK